MPTIYLFQKPFLLLFLLTTFEDDLNLWSRTSAKAAVKRLWDTGAMAETYNDVVVEGFLAIDFDGTLIACNSFHRELFALIAEKRSIEMLKDLVRTRSFTKAKIKARVGELAPALDYDKCINQTLLEIIWREKSRGTYVVIATGASHATITRFLAKSALELPFVSSSTTLNLTRHNKAQVLQSMTQHRAFTYIGDSMADVPVFRAASRGYLVKFNEKLIRQISKSNSEIEPLQMAYSTCEHL